MLVSCYRLVRKHVFRYLTFFDSGLFNRKESRIDVRAAYFSRIYIRRYVISNTLYDDRYGLVYRFANTI